MPAPARQKLPTLNKDRIRAAFGGRCLSCRSGENLEIDHVVPLVDGGTHDIVNLQVLCKRCHLAKTRKGAKTDYRPRSFRGTRLERAYDAAKTTRRSRSR